jgi:hypothetical protein
MEDISDDPLYNEDELTQMHEEGSDYRSGSEATDDESLQEINCEWCKCTNCDLISTNIKRVCCCTNTIISDKKGDLLCISLHDNFNNLVMNKDALLMLKEDLLKTYKHDSDKKKMINSNKNETFRYLTYRQFIKWVNAGKKMAKGRRMIIPSCVVTRIQEAWPEASGIYKGFKEALQDS